jgi:DNA-binding MarR family transcriptional regulator
MSNIAASPIAPSDAAGAGLDELQAHRPEALITFRVSVLAQLLARVVDTAVGETLGLSSRQWRLLVVLNRLGPSTSGAAARMASLDHSQVSRAAFELVSKGLIAQAADAQDRRRQVLALTPQGVAVLRAGLPGSMAREQRLRGRLGEADYAALTRALAALTEEARGLLAARKAPARGRRQGA